MLRRSSSHQRLQFRPQLILGDAGTDELFLHLARLVALTATAEALSAHFGRKNKKRTEQIEGILETLRGLGQL